MRPWRSGIRSMAAERWTVPRSPAVVLRRRGVVTILPAGPVMPGPAGGDEGGHLVESASSPPWTVRA
jgi:hypothetical protein